jgi:hypothetical protein
VNLINGEARHEWSSSATGYKLETFFHVIASQDRIQNIPLGENEEF